MAAGVLPTSPSPGWLPASVMFPGWRLQPFSQPPLPRDPPPCLCVLPSFYKGSSYCI